MVDPRERINDPEESQVAFWEAMQTGLWTAMPAIIQSFDPEQMTVKAQPSIQGVLTDRNGNKTTVDMPECLDCPVQFVGAGGFSVTFPIKEGNECLLVFASRCIDAWWQNGGIQPPLELRMHDLSDGFALIGFKSLPNVVPDISTTSAQLRSDDGTVFVDLSDDKVTVEAPNIKAHASEVYQWDVFGYGQKVTYEGSNTWTVDNYMTPKVGDTVNVNNNDINDPEVP